MERKPQVVTEISLSKSISMAGRIRMTQNILTTAPLAISMHMERMISMSE